MSLLSIFSLSHVCLAWPATDDPGEEVLPGVDSLAAPNKIMLG